MRKILLCILVIINSSAFAQANDFCSTTRSLIGAATGNFRKYIVRETGTYYEPYHSDMWPSPFAYANDIGTKAFMFENRSTKQRYFSQIITTYVFADGLAQQVSACLASDPPGNWVTKRYDEYLTRFTNSSLNIDIQIIADARGTKIQIIKLRPSPPMVRSQNLIPYLLNTGEPDYILVDSATMAPLDDLAYDFNQGLYYSEDNLLTYRFLNANVEWAYGFLRRDGNTDLNLPVTTESLNRIQFVEGRAWLKKNGLWYFIDKKGNQIIPPTYQELQTVTYQGFQTEIFIESMCAVMKNGKWGYVDKTGRLAIPLVYEDASFFYKGLAEIKKNSKWGIINKEGKEIIIPEYDSISNGDESGFYKVQKNGNWGFLNKEGKEIIIPQYDSIPGQFRGNLCAVRKNKKWGAIDTTGKIVIPFTYSEQLNVFNEVVIFSQNKLFGLLDKTGKQIIPPRYRQIMEFTEGVGAVERNYKMGFIDKTGKEVIPVKYVNAYAFENGLARVVLNGKFGFIDKSGKTIIPFVYDAVYNFMEDLALVSQNGKWGYIDKTGKVIIPFIYNIAYDFKLGKALVSNEDHVEFFIDRAGREYREK